MDYFFNMPLNNLFNDLKIQEQFFLLVNFIIYMIKVPKSSESIQNFYKMYKFQFYSFEDNVTYDKN